MTPASPQLLIKEINDTYTQGNFKNLRDYFNKQNQLLNFNFVEFNFTAAVTNQKIAHGLGLIPQDVIVTRITGTGAATLNWGLFDSSNLDITTTGACRIRLFVGSYWNFQTALASGASDTQAVTPTSTATSTSTSTTTSTSTSTTTTTTFSMPAGSIVAFAGSTAPSGWWICDGSALSRVLFPTLFAAIGTTWGVGDGSTTFNVPNTSGAFLRGVGTQTISAIATPTIVLGTTQGDQVQGHYHSISGGVISLAAGAAGHNVDNAGTILAASATTMISDGTNGTPRIGTETRPANIGVNYIIKT